MPVLQGALPSDQANAIAFDADGNIYVGTQCDGLAIVQAAEALIGIRGYHALYRTFFHRVCGGSGASCWPGSWKAYGRARRGSGHQSMLSC